MQGFQRPLVVRLLELVADAIEAPMGFTELVVEYENHRVRRYGLSDLRNSPLELQRYDERARALLDELGAMI